MTLSLDGRVVVITGASRGLGKALAQHLANHGARLGLLARDKVALSDLAGRLPTDAISIGCDVTDADQVTAAHHRVAERFGKIDAVVANAGGQLAARRVGDLPIGKWYETLDLNLTGAYFTARAGYEYLQQSRVGRMVFVSSIAAKVPLSRMSAYAAAKAGVEGLVRALCVEWAEDGICVNAVSSGLIDTVSSSEIPEKIREKILSRTTLHHPGNVSDVVGAILFLIGDASPYISGQILSVDGGYGLG